MKRYWLVISVFRFFCDMSCKYAKIIFMNQTFMLFLKKKRLYFTQLLSFAIIKEEDILFL